MSNIDINNTLIDMHESEGNRNTKVYKIIGWM
jgi:hypothetical protein